MNKVVLGLDSDRDNTLALDWAAEEAHLRHVPLVIVRAYYWSPGAEPWQTAEDRGIIDQLRGEAESVARHAADRVHRQWSTVEVSTHTVLGLPGPVLVDASQSAALTVLGSRQLPALGAVVLGSTSSAVVARAASPVVVVAAPRGLGSEPAAVVVGIDPAVAADSVLDFAFDYASRHALPLHAVLCWRPDRLAQASWRPPQPAPDEADRWLAEAIAGWCQNFPDVAVQHDVVRDHPVAGLVAVSAAQDLLVVGTRHRHPHLGALIGSVSQGVLRHATCPVAVVPGVAGSPT